MKTVIGSVNDDLNISLLLDWQRMTDGNDHSAVRAEIAVFFAKRMSGAKVDAAAKELLTIWKEQEKAGAVTASLVARRARAFARLMDEAEAEYPEACEIIRRFAL